MATKEEAPQRKHDESDIPGGRYLIEGKLYNSEKQRIHEDGRLLTQEELAEEEAML